MPEITTSTHGSTKDSSKAQYFRLHHTPPEGDPRACKRIRSDGTPCRNWQMRGADYCWWHRLRGAAAQTVHNDKHMAKSRFYSKVLGPKLRDVVEEILDAPESEKLGAIEELTIIRGINADVAAMYEVAQQSSNQDIRLAAGGMLRDSCEQVIRAAERATNIAAKSREMYPVETLQVVVNQIVRMIHDCLVPYLDTPLTIEHVQYLCDTLMYDLRLPGDTSRGTNLDVTDDVMLMDASVPGPSSVATSNE